MTTPNVEYLQEHGPATGDDLPSKVRPRDKRHGLIAFNLADARSFGKGATVYYLDSHDRQRVIRRWLEAHRDAVADMRRRELTKLFTKQGQSWAEAAKPLVDVFAAEKPDSEKGHGSVSETECPRCGEAMTNNKLPQHLPECDG